MNRKEMEEIVAAMDLIARYSASRRVHAHTTAAAGTLISQTGLALLRRIVDLGHPLIGDLARASHMDPSFVSRHIGQLESNGWIRREPDPHDDRAVRVAVTYAGRDVVERFDVVAYEHLDQALSEWSAQDRTEVARLLPRLVDDLRRTAMPELKRRGRPEADHVASVKPRKRAAQARSEVG